ncbi:LuxS/MPP-like metallohydrolase [Fomitiporia mediterranea MF3/22]|uniref:LuxS/MPP-like metallohydrolase n=1 Tax=Fomitiporia mediterranea (strain MF3/22) TaxID=694068 RepID=UPI00044089B2|nr:LuxS/MPP-like metallohydrolase [Fomitiporia mediterranea MF3/22]EJD03327.1 LuxS/MPP-like metallohydrolase [Fomitiporia mediterranea MF3/22]
MLKEDSQNWESVPAKQKVPAYQRYTKPIQTSSLDDRQYAVIRLGNRLEATVVSDKDAEMSAACMNVAVGYFNDSDDMPGQAHFCEHLLFLGSDNHPKENGFDKYLSLHSGQSNAATGGSRTTYYFEVASDALEEMDALEEKKPLEKALDYFSAFFYCPLFHEGSVLREIKAVHSEFSKNFQLDVRRIRYVENSLARPAHPLRKFGTGNKYTLMQKFLASGKKAAALKARKELKKWWEKEYCAGRMCLAVVGKEPLEELTDMVVRLFSPIKYKGLDPLPLASPEQPYGKDELGKFVHVRTIKERYEVTVVFPVAWQEPLWREDPTYFLSHLLGHEGPGSLHAYLKNKGWLESLGAGPVHPGRGISTLKVTMMLTKDGFKQHHREVVIACFKYINFLRHSEFPEWMWKELEYMKKLDFRLKQKGTALSHAKGIAASMSYPTPRALLLSGPELLWEWNETLVTDTLAGLDIENSYVLLAARDHEQIPKGETWHKERWYGATYVKKKFDAGFISACRKDNDIPEFSLPKRNPFLPKNVDVHRVHVAEAKKRPALVMDTPLMEVWHKKDDQFWVPRAFMQIAARTPAFQATPRRSILTQLFVELVEDALNEYSYYALLAGLEYSLTGTTHGFTMEISGYNDKLHVLAEKVIDKIKHLEIRKDRMVIIIKRIRRDVENERLSSPRERSKSYLGYILEEPEFTTEEELEASEGITAEELFSHIKKLLSRLKFVVLVDGNLWKEKTSFRSSSHDFFPKVCMLCTEHDVLILTPTGCNYVWELPVYNPKEANSGVSYYCHIGNGSDPRIRVTCHLLLQILEEPVYDTLRTKEQLGYYVNSRIRTDTESIGLLVVIQSELDPRYLESRIDAFLMYMRKVIRDLSNDLKTFESHKSSLRNLWTEKDKYLSEETDRFWSAIQDGYYDFQENEKDAELLQSISLSEVRTIFEAYLDPSSKTRSKLSVHMRSKNASKHPKPKVSRQAAEDFLSLLQKEHIPINKAEYDRQCENEPTVPEMHEYLKKTDLSEFVSDNEKVKSLFEQLDLLVKKYPVPTYLPTAKAALELKHIKDGAKFKCDLKLSGSPKPVEKFKVE